MAHPQNVCYLREVVVVHYSAEAIQGAHYDGGGVHEHDDDEGDEYVSSDHVDAYAGMDEGYGNGMDVYAR